MAHFVLVFYQLDLCTNKYNGGQKKEHFLNIYIRTKSDIKITVNLADWTALHFTGSFFFAAVFHKSFMIHLLLVSEVCNLSCGKFLQCQESEPM